MGRRESRPTSVRRDCSPRVRPLYGLRRAAASRVSTRVRSIHGAPRQPGAVCTSWTCARPRNTRPAICAVHARRLAASLYRKPTGGSAPFGAPASCLSTTTASATMTASWLKQMGWTDIAVLAAGPTNGDRETGPHVPRVLGLEAASAPHIDALDLRDRLAAGKGTVIDLNLSTRYAVGHIPVPGLRSGRASARHWRRSPPVRRLC